MATRNIDDLTQQERNELIERAMGKLTEWIEDSGENTHFIIGAIMEGQRDITVRQVAGDDETVAVWFGETERARITVKDLGYLVCIFNLHSDVTYGFGLVFPFDREGVVTMAHLADPLGKISFKVELRGRGEDTFLLRISEVA